MPNLHIYARKRCIGPAPRPEDRPVYKRCPACGGDGDVGPQTLRVPCPTCGGTGVAKVTHQ